MWTKASSYALLCAALVASAVAQNAAGSSGTTGGGDVLITMPIQVDGSFKDLQLLRGESIEDAAVSFARNHGLLANSDATRVRAVVDQLSGMLRGRIAEMQATETATAAAPAPAPPTPVVQLSMPLTINQVTREFKKFEGETVETAVERFLYDGDFTMGAMRELFPQVVDIVLAKLEQLQPARKELFSFSLSIDGREATARHFENGDPMEEARETFRGVGITDAAYIEQLAPQIANAINQRIAEMRTAEQPSTPPAQPATPPAPTRELFSLPLTANERATVLVHYEGYTSRESAVRYVNDNGLATSPNAENMLSQLVAIIDNRIVELAQEAAARAQAEAEEAARVAAAAQQQQQRQPLVRLPIDLGNNQAATLEYFEGDSVERTVEVFLTQIGMQEGPMFTQNVAQLADAIRQQLPAPPMEQSQEALEQQQQQPPAVEPYVQLPVTLGGRVFDLLYFKGEQPATTANTFCVEKYEIIRAEMGMQFDGDQLLECKNLLEKTLLNLIAQKQQQQQQQTQTEPQPEEPIEPAPVEATQPEPVAVPQEPVAQPMPPRSPSDFLLSLDIMINGKNEPFDVYVNDDPEQLARAFCETHKLGFENVGPIVEAVKEQIANLK